MWRDDAYLLDMLLAARKVSKYAQAVDEARFFQDDLVQDAIKLQITIIGEAARKISKEFREPHPEIPWPRIVGMRNRLVHEYFRVIPEKVWETVVEDIPQLIGAIEPLVPPGPEYG